MSLDELVSILLLLFLAQAITTTSRAELAIDCPPSNCSQSCPEIRLPLSLNSAPGYSQSPSPSPSGGGGGGGGSSNVVVAVDYHRGLIKLRRPWSTCPWQTNSTNDSYPSFSYYCLRRFESIDFPDCYYSCFMDSTDYTLTKCTTELVSSIIGNESIAGPIPCLSGGTGTGYFVYAVDSSNMPIDSLTYHCSVVSKGTAGSTDDRTQNLTFREKILEDFSRTVPWDYDINDGTLRGGSCRYNQIGGSCGYNKATNKTFCISNNQDDNHGELCS